MFAPIIGVERITNTKAVKNCYESVVDPLKSPLYKAAQGPRKSDPTDAPG